MAVMVDPGSPSFGPQARRSNCAMDVEGSRAHASFASNKTAEATIATSGKWRLLGKRFIDLDLLAHGAGSGGVVRLDGEKIHSRSRCLSAHRTGSPPRRSPTTTNGYRALSRI